MSTFCSVYHGTARFTSLDAHRGLHPSYRGDLEILAYNILYWLTGSLPWLVSSHLLLFYFYLLHYLIPKQIQLA